MLGEKKAGAISLSTWTKWKDLLINSQLTETYLNLVSLFLKFSY